MFWNNEVLSNLEGADATIAEDLRLAHSSYPRAISRQTGLRLGLGARCRSLPAGFPFKGLVFTDKPASDKRGRAEKRRRLPP
jgi:hypothetical protein